jgi:arginine/ornithine N-succinyltransferase beta subunit
MQLNGNELASPLADGRPALREGRPAAGNAPVTLSSGEDDPEQFRLLLARPVGRTDLAALLEIAGHVNVASMRGEKERNQVSIEQSIRTLAGDLAWPQGLLFLAADLFPTDGGPCELAGNIKLQVGWGGHWQRRKHARLFNVPGLQAWAEHEYLTYRPNHDDEYTLEFAGLSVLPGHQGKKVARFLTQAWVLFVLLYQEELRRRIGTISHLYANLLTADAGGKYPFYEQAVKRLFGGLDYDTVDAYRYARCNARSPILDEFLDARGDQPRARILYHLLPEEIRQDLGKVRDKSVGCQKNLERFGFCRTDKHDVLDGGPYFENTLPRLGRSAGRREYVVRCARAGEIRPDAPRLTLAPARRPMPYFRCARARCQVQGDEVLLGEEVYDALLLRHHEPVAALAAPLPPREAVR